MRSRLLVLFSLAALTLAPRIVLADPMRTQLQAALDAARQRLAIRGASASVRTPDGSWSIASGESHAGVPIRPDMVFGIGSNTKTLTTLVLLRLQERGALDLDDRIARHLAPIANVDSNITVRQLLHHDSGVGEYAWGQMYRDSILARATRVWTPPELVVMIPAPQFAPGTSWSYCNSNYLLAGMIAERVGGAPLPALLRTEVTARVGLDSTRYCPQEALVGTLAHRWIGAQDFSVRPMASEWSGAWAAGAVLATSGEMTELYSALFAGQVVTSASLSEMMQFSGPDDYGLGMSRKTIGGQVVFGHSGEIRGFSSVALWVPALSSAVTVLTNQADAPAFALADTLVRVLTQQTLSAPPGGPGGSVALLRVVSPNPARGAVRIVCTAPRAGEAELAVFRVDGRRVRTVAQGDWGVGPQEFVWDGRDDAGQEAAPGVYFVRVQTPGASETRRIVRLR